MFHKLLVALGLRPLFSGAAAHSNLRGLFTDVYLTKNGWYFSWFDETHTRGEVKGPFNDRAKAEQACEIWEMNLPPKSRVCIQSTGLVNHG